MSPTPIAIHLVDGLAVIEMQAGSVDNSPSNTRIAEHLVDLVANVPQKGIIVDLKNVQFLSAELVAALLNLRRHADQGAGDVVLAHLRPDLRRVCRARKLDKLFRLYDSLAAAIDQVLAPTSDESQPAA